MGLATLLRSRHFPYPVWLAENWRFRDARWLPGVYLVSKQQCPVHPSSRAPGDHLLNRLNTPSLPVHDGTSLLVESGYNGDKESLGTEKRGDLMWGVGVGAQKRLWGVWKKEKGAGGVLCGTVVSSCGFPGHEKTKEIREEIRQRDLTEAWGAEEGGP